jgi:hypothetical protein
MNRIYIFRILFAAVLMLRLPGGTVASAQTAALSEYDIKAGFLCNFGKFVDWPANSFDSPKAPLVIGIYGDSPFHNDLSDVVRGHMIGGRRVIVKSASFNTMDKCQVLFICPSEGKKMSAILRKLDGVGVLTVTQNIDPFKSGVMINFTAVNGQVRFEINDAAARRAGLKISSKLLMLAARTSAGRENQKRQALLCALSQ